MTRTNEAEAPAAPPVAVTVPCVMEELPVAYVELDRDGRMIYANQAARELHGNDGDIIGKSAWDLMPPKERDESQVSFNELMRTGRKPPSVRRPIYTPRGYRTMEIHRCLMRDTLDRPAGVRSIAVDVTEAVIAHEEAQEARAWLESVLESVAEAIIVTDALGFVRKANRAAEEMFGWRARELVGQGVEKKIPILHSETEGGERLSFQMALHAPARAVATVLDRNRLEMKVEVSASPIVDKEKGYTLGVVSLWRRFENPCGCADPNPANAG